MAGPSAADVQLAERIDALAATLTAFRVEAAAKFAGIEAELALVRKLGDRLLGASVAGVGMMVIWAALAGWYGSAIHSDVAQHGRRLDAIEARLDKMDAKLDTLINRTAPKAGVLP
jgi:hypothetical protein